jgi:hypothetical protein
MSGGASSQAQKRCGVRISTNGSAGKEIAERRGLRVIACGLASPICRTAPARCRYGPSAQPDRQGIRRSVPASNLAPSPATRSAPDSWTGAAEAGASVFNMMEVSRHNSIDMLGGYVRSANALHDRAGAAFL